MEFRSLEEFDRAFFARYAPGGAHGGEQPVAYDPFLRGAAPPPAEEPAEPERPGPLQTFNAVVSCAIIALLAIGLLGFAVPLAFGVKLLNVTRDSMQPDYPVNSLLWVAPTKYEKISIGDDVTYLLPSGASPTLRVTDVNREELTLTVQGINDGGRDEELIQYSQVMGVVRFHIHGLGRPLAALNGESGALITIAVVLGIALLWGGTFFLSKLKGGKRKKA